MKKKLFCLLLCLTAMLLTTPETAYADMGPKPSVVLDFEGLEGQNYYVTLLSSTPSTGPYSSTDMYSDEELYIGEEREHDAWSKFAAYQDEDGYYFLQYFADCTDTSQFIWGYYPPKQFKILLYFPELSSFAVSEKTYQ